LRTNPQLQAVNATPEPPNELEQDQLVTFSPSSRGKFSHDRETWERIHQQRYLQWQLGESIDSIAAEHGVTYNAVKHSIQWCETRLGSADVLAGRAMRLKLTTIAALGERYVAELGKLISNKNPLVQLKALEHVRRTVGIEQQGGVHVNTQVNVGSTNSIGHSYEERLEQILAAQEKRFQTEKPPLALPSGTDPAQG
jgi:hypothetical protein